MNDFFWKLTHARSWPTTDASVSGCEWVKFHDHAGGTAGHYRVSFSYRAGDHVELYQGGFCHQGNRNIAPYAVGEHLEIQYDPRKPSRSHFSGAASNYEKLEAIAVVTVFALLAGYMLYTF